MRFVYRDDKSLTRRRKDFRYVIVRYLLLTRKG